MASASIGHGCQFSASAPDRRAAPVGIAPAGAPAAGGKTSPDAGARQGGGPDPVPGGGGIGGKPPEVPGKEAPRRPGSPRGSSTHPKRHNGGGDLQPWPRR